MSWHLTQNLLCGTENQCHDSNVIQLVLNWSVLLDIHMHIYEHILIPYLISLTHLYHWLIQLDLNYQWEHLVKAWEIICEICVRLKLSLSDQSVSYNYRKYIHCQCRRKTFMVHQTFVWWALYILYKFAKFPIRHLGLAIGNVRRFSPTLHCK